MDTAHKIVFLAFCIFTLIAIVSIPIAQRIEYKRDCKKYGKKYADELARRK